jgi:hypothetical protein
MMRGQVERELIGAQAGLQGRPMARDDGFTKQVLEEI